MNLIIVSFLLFLTACAQESLQPQPIGTKITGSFKIGDKLFYLPEGEWTLIASGDYETHLVASFKPCSEFNWIYLADIRGNTLYKAVYAYANIRGCRVSDWADEPCKRTDFYYKNDMKRSLKDQFCLSVSHNFPYLVKATGRYTEIFQWLKNNHISIPTTAMAVTFTRYFRPDFMSVTYFFNPEANGIPPSIGNTWGTNDWNKNLISQYPEKKEYAEQLVKWGNQMSPLILYGFNREGSEPHSIPKTPY